MNDSRDICLTLKNLDWPVMAAIGVNGFHGIHTRRYRAKGPYFVVYDDGTFASFLTWHTWHNRPGFMLYFTTILHVVFIFHFFRIV